MATILPAHRTAIVNLYTALFNRAPDASGSTFWAQAYADGASLAYITQSFLGTVEGRAAYPAALTSAQFVAAFYQTVFGRAPDAGGLAFWTAALDAAGGAGSDAARAALAGQLVAVVSQPLSARPADIDDAAYARTVGDRTLFAHKADVGNYVSSLGIDDIMLTRRVLALVTTDPASVPIAKAFALNGGAIALPPEPLFAIVPSGSAADLAARFAAYTGASASVDVTGMDASKLAVVAGAIGKIASGGILGTLGLDAAGYQSADVAAIAPKLAAGATLDVAGGAGTDVVVLREFGRATTIAGGGGLDLFDAVVDGITPSNTTLSANHAIAGGAGSDTLRIFGVKGNVGDVLNGATVSGVEWMYIEQDGGTATLSATAEMEQIGVGGRGDFTVNDVDATLVVLGGTGDTGKYTLNTAGALARMALVGNAQADIVAVNGSATTFELNRSGGHVINALALGDAITGLTISGNGDIGIVSLAGNAAGPLAITVTGAGQFIITTIDSPVQTLDASGATGQAAMTFSKSVGQVIGGSAGDTIVLSTAPAGGGGTTVTGNGGADVFALTTGISQTGPVTPASLDARMVTITDLSAGDLISVETPVMPSTAADTPLRIFIGAGADLHAQTVDVAGQMQALATKVPYGAFTFGGASYLLVDNAMDGLGAGDMLIRLTGSPDLTRITYADSELRMT